MKKLFTLLVLLLLFTGCSDSDDKSNDPAGLVGKWEFLRITADVKTADAELTELFTKWILEDVERMGDIEFTPEGEYKYFDGMDRRWYQGTYEIQNGEVYTCFTEPHYGKECDLLTYALKGNSLKVIHDMTERRKEYYPEAGVERVIQYLEYTRK